MKTNVNKGMIVNIYRSDYRSQINVLKDFERAVIIDDEVEELFKPTEDMPAIRIVRREIYGSPYIHAEPMEAGSYAFGGSFVYSGDSRMISVNRYPIPLHDRDMSKE